MPPIQKILYDSLRAFGYCYLSTDRDGTINMDTRPPSHRIALYPSGELYEVRRDGRYHSLRAR